jgi:hypothetical protein
MGAISKCPALLGTSRSLAQPLRPGAVEAGLGTLGGRPKPAYWATSSRGKSCDRQITA